jgi:murein L,D-transpeptidase YcbB/YkuD
VGEASHASDDRSRINRRRRKAAPAGSGAAAAVEPVWPDHWGIRCGSRNQRQKLSAGQGLTVDGIVGPATWAKLQPYREASPTLKQGSEGPAVAWLQQALSGADVAVQFPPYSGAVDGVFGPATASSVSALQSWAGISASGVVDDNTWFIWLTPGSAQQLTLERACGLLRDLGFG